MIERVVMLRLELSWLVQSELGVSSQHCHVGLGGGDFEDGENSGRTM